MEAGKVTNNNVDVIGVIDGEYRNSPQFEVQFPKELVYKYYPNPTSYVPELDGHGYQQFFDISKLSVEDMKEYILPYYYVDLAMSKNEKVRKDKQLLDLLTFSCIESFFGALN